MKAQLLRTRCNAWYVTKSSFNPAHRRLLINEFIGSAILQCLGIATPAVAFVQITKPLLISGALGGALYPGCEKSGALHFGSKYPGNPHRVAVYDFVPESFVSHIVNLGDFKGVLAFDKWTANNDHRQAIFLRRPASVAKVASSISGSLRMQALMIDNGNIFTGAAWSFPAAPIAGLHLNKSVYQDAYALNCFDPYLNRIVNFPEDMLRAIVADLPREWASGEEHALERLTKILLRRREQVPELLIQTIATGHLAANKS